MGEDRRLNNRFIDRPFHDLTNPEEITSMQGDVSDLHTKLTGSYTEERRLIAAVLQRAILDLVPVKEKDTHNHDERQRAIAWFKDVESHEGYISFPDACQILDLDHELLSKTLSENNYYEDQRVLYPFIGDKTKAYGRRKTRL